MSPPRSKSITIKLPKTRPALIRLALSCLEDAVTYFDLAGEEDHRRDVERIMRSIVRTRINTASNPHQK